MGGKGKNTQEGQAGRVKDGTELMETAFSIFRDISLEILETSYFVKVYAADQKGLNLVAAYNPKTVCVPFIYGNSIAENLGAVQFNVIVPDYLQGKIIQGAEYGQIKITLGDYLLQTIPLVADRSTEKAGALTCLADSLIN